MLKQEPAVIATNMKDSGVHVENMAPGVEHMSVSDYLRLNPQPIWFKDEHRRKLYSIILPACLLVAATNGFDGSMMNGLQAGISCHTIEISFDTALHTMC